MPLYQFRDGELKPVVPIRTIFQAAPAPDPGEKAVAVTRYIDEVPPSTANIFFSKENSTPGSTLVGYIIEDI